MKLLVGLTVITVLVALYVVWLRPWMKQTDWGRAALDKIEPIERVAWWKSETILWNRFKVLVGTLLTALVAIDWNTVAPIIPEKYRGIALAAPTIFTAIDGLIGERLRRDTTVPLEIVGMRTDAPPSVKAAAAEAKVAADNAATAAKEAGAV